MAEVGGVNQPLVQAQAVERLQEASRKSGDAQQHGFAVALNRQVDTRERTVTGKEKASSEELDPNAKRNQEEGPATPRDGGRDAENPAEPDWNEEEDRGRHVDARA